MTARVHQLSQRHKPPHRLAGELIPLVDVPLFIELGWQLLDELVGDPAGITHVLMQPPATERALEAAE